MKGWIWQIAAVAVIAVGSGVAGAGDNNYLEDFTTKQFCDALNTTAMWDTIAGELRLPEYEVALAGDYDTPGLAYGVAISGDYAYVGDNTNGLVVVDISDPTSPAFAGSYDTPGEARGVAISGDYAYVADGENGLVVLDTSDPTLPTFAGSYGSSDWSYAVAISGDYAYVADGTHGVVVLDISDPTSPTLAGSCDTPGDAYGVAISGDRAYVADDVNGLVVIDISDPTSPTLAGGYNTAGWARGVAIGGDHVYVADWDNGLVVLRIGSQMAPTLTGGYTIGSVRGVAISGDYAYMAAGGNGLVVVDISDPTSPTLAGSYNTAGSAYAVAISGDHAYVADYANGLVVVDISNPTLPTLAGGYDTIGWAWGVAISGDYAYVADYNSLVVLDISNPATPTLAGGYDTPGYAIGVAISGDHAYVGDADNGLVVLDISDPTSPALAGGYDTAGQAGGVAISGDHAYVADDFNGLVVVDISDPTSPTLAGGYDTSGYPYGVAISGDYAYVADYNSLVVLDISDPTSPTLAGSYDTPAAAYAVAISGDNAYVAHYGGLLALEVSHRAFNLSSNAGQSLVINELDGEIHAVRMTSAQSDSIYWYASADSGSVWDEVTPGDTWHRLTSSGNDLIWRSSHVYKGARANPKCTSLEVECLYSSAVVDSIVDVPDDQGSWAYLFFTRSGLDFVEEETYPVEGYFVYRRIDDLAMVTRVLDEGLPVEDGQFLSRDDGETSLEALRCFPGARALSLDGEYYILVEEFESGGAPPGMWAVVADVSAHQEDQYVCPVPTVADSTSSMTYSVYCVSAETTTPSVYYFSPPDSGYSVDNLPPEMPGGLTAQYMGGTDLWLHWNLGSENDLSHWAVYRGKTPDFVADEVSRIGTTTDTSFVDGEFGPGEQYYYKVSAFDVHENESPHALLTPGGVTGVPGGGHSYVNALFQNVPNPFGSETQIAFSLERAGRVRLMVFDAKGRLVRGLVDEERAPNRYVEVWDGRDGRGRPVAAGTYFYRLELAGWSAVRKMTFAK